MLQSILLPRTIVGAPNPVKLGVAIDTLVGFINTLKVVDADPIVGRRYFFVTVSKSRVKYEVKVIGVCAGYVVYRRTVVRLKGFFEKL